MDHFLGALLAQSNDQNHKQAIYYLSRTMIGAEYHYNPIEKECLALVFAVHKMWHYLMGQHIQVIFRVNPLRLLMTKLSSLNCRLAKWAILLSQYEMQFTPQKGGQRVSCGRFFGWSSSSRTSKLYNDLSDEIAEANVINASSKEQVW